MKKEVNLFFVLVLTMFLLSFVNSAVSSVTYSNDCSPLTKTIMKMSGSTNAHGEIYSGTNYNYFLCANSVDSRTCSTTEGTCKGIEGCNDATNKGDCDIYLGEVCSWIPANKIIGLSSETNAHAESPSQDNYDVDVCYGDLRCASTSGDCPLIYPIEILSLSSFTNAHIGSFADYPIKVCCKEGGVIVPFCGDLECNGNEICGDTNDSPECNTDCDSCPVPSVYWTRDEFGNEEITTIEASLDETEIYLILENSGQTSGTLDFNIYEKDLGFWPDNDDLIKIITANIGSDGKAIGTWIVTQEDLDATGEINFDEFYFKEETNDVQSGDLTITIRNPAECIGINYCRDALTEGQCSSCGGINSEIASLSVQEKESSITCGNGYDCYCYWENNFCKPKWTGLSDDPQDPPIGTCTYTEDTTQDDCEDGILEYFWTTVWTWDVLNTQHYDPDKKNEKCFSDGTVAICPAQIQLPFFTTYSLIIAIVLIVLVYFLILKNSKKVSKRKKEKK